MDRKLGYSYWAIRLQEESDYEVKSENFSFLRDPGRSNDSIQNGSWVLRLCTVIKIEYIALCLLITYLQPNFAGIFRWLRLKPVRE